MLQLEPRNADYRHREISYGCAEAFGAKRLVRNLLGSVGKTPRQCERARAAVEEHERRLLADRGRDVMQHGLVAGPGELVRGDQIRLEPRHVTQRELAAEKFP